MDVDEDGVVGGHRAEDSLGEDRSVDAIRCSEQIRQVKTCSVINQAENLRSGL